VTGASLSGAAFAGLLARLDPDAERAGAAYEDLRRALVSFFTWRGALTPEDCADETLDRLAARLDDGVAVNDVPRFAHGIARLVLLEHWRRADARRAPLEDVPPGPGREAPEDEAVHACLDRCLASLPAEARDLILRYYAADGGGRIAERKRLAASLGVSESGLRNRAQRLRDRLEACIRGCVGAHPSDTDA
jgi:DNA-directed RNA polymerase specialized sigma24 family protein